MASEGNGPTIVNGVVFLGYRAFVEFRSRLSRIDYCERTYFAGPDQCIDGHRHGIEVESNQIGASRGRNVDPPRHAVSANVSKELSKFPCVVAASYLAESLFFLSLEEEGGHLGFAHFGADGGFRHTFESFSVTIGARFLNLSLTPMPIGATT